MTQALYYEAGQEFTAMSLLTDSGDHMAFNAVVQRFSKYPGRTPIILPDGLISGGKVSPAASLTDDAVDIAITNCNLAGVQKIGSSAIAADTDLAITREVTNAFLIASIVITAAGAYDVIEGTAHATAHSATRGADGGPPFIPVGNIEIAQVKLTSVTSAPVSASEIFQVPGVSQEMAYLPNYEVNFSRVSDRVLGYAGVTFATAKPLIHTGALPAHVYAEYYSPLFSILQNCRSFDMPRLSGSISSEQFYDGAKGSSSESIGTGSFEFSPDDVVGDPFLGHLGKDIWMKYKPDDLKTEYMQCLGKIYDSGNQPASGRAVYSCTIVADSEGKRIIA